MEPDPGTERLRRAVADAIEEQKRLEDELLERGGAPQPGDLFAPQRPGDPVNWAVIQQHPDDPHLLFLVPADDYPPHGTSDVVVPDHAQYAPLTLRCGLGIWVQSDYFAKSRRVGFLDELTLHAARRKLADMVRGRIEGTAAARENEADPDYEEWMKRVAGIRAALESALDRYGVVLRLDEFRSGWPMNIFCDDPTPGTWSYGPLKHIAEGPGDLYFVADSMGVRGLWTGEGGPPPIRAVGDGGRMRRASRWSLTTDATSCQSTPLFPWREGRVALRIGPGKGHRVAIDRQQSSPLAKRPSDWTTGCEVVAIEFPSSRGGASDRPMFAGRTMAASRAVSKPKTPPATSTDDTKGDVPKGILRPEYPLEFALFGGMIRGRLGLTQASMLKVSFETREPGFAGRRIQIAFRDEARGLRVTMGDVTLEPAKNGPPPWWGGRECELTIDPPFQITIRVEPGGN